MQQVLVLPNRAKDIPNESEYLMAMLAQRREEQRIREAEAAKNQNYLTANGFAQLTDAQKEAMIRDPEFRKKLGLAGEYTGDPMHDARANVGRGIDSAVTGQGVSGAMANPDLAAIIHNLATGDNISAAHYNDRAQAAALGPEQYQQGQRIGAGIEMDAQQQAAHGLNLDKFAFEKPLKLAKNESEVAENVAQAGTANARTGLIGEQRNTVVHDRNNPNPPSQGGRASASSKPVTFEDTSAWKGYAKEAQATQKELQAMYNKWQDAKAKVEGNVKKKENEALAKSYEARTRALEAKLQKLNDGIVQVRDTWKAQQQMRQNLPLARHGDANVRPTLLPDVPGPQPANRQNLDDDPLGLFR